MKLSRKKAVVFILAVLVMMLAASTAHAAQYKKEFVKTNGRWYYYNAKGEKVKGLKKIGKKYYYFHPKTGIQRNGWIKYKGKYMYFRWAEGKKGSLVTGHSVDGYSIDENGFAIASGTRLNNLKYVATANTFVYTKTNWNMSKEQALYTLFKYVVNQFAWTVISTEYTDSNMAVNYAYWFFDLKKGDCVCGAAGFAYLAAARDFNNVNLIYSGGHGWAEIDGNVYDPNWAWNTGSIDDYFNCPYSLSGVNGRPAYSGNRLYVAKVL